MSTPSMRKVEEKNTEIVATNIVASVPSERRLTETAIACANSFKYQSIWG